MTVEQMIEALQTELERQGKVHLATVKADIDGYVWLDGQFDLLALAEVAIASADTRPKGQDAKQGLAGTASGAVGEAETPKGTSHDHP